MIAIWHDGRILMINHSYKPQLSWPGGSIERGELPVEAALRELREELSLEVPMGALHFAGQVLERWEYRYDYVRIFELALQAPPRLKLDGTEVVAARFMTPEEALARPLTPFVRGYLEGKRRSSQSAASSAQYSS